MRCALLLAALACTLACGGSPTGPSGDGGRAPRLSRTRFLAFGDSFTAGEVTNPVASAGTFHKLIIVPAASYPTVLESQLKTTYASQGGSIAVQNAGASNERILEGAQRFPGVFASSNAEVVLLMEGVNGLPQVGPDISSAVMRIMVQAATNGNARVFVGSMLPQVAGRPRATTPVSELLAYNTTLQQMSTLEGATFVDLYNAMLPEAATLMGSDGLHPTEAGYRRIAELFFQAIRTRLEE